MILICAATLMELDACLSPIHFHFEEFPPGAGKPWVRTKGRLAFAVTGVGIPMTLAKLLPLATMLKPELILNAGIAGAYPGSGLAIGDVVAGLSELFGDLGMETPEADGFLPLSGFAWADEEYRRPLDLALEPLGLGGRTAGESEGSIRIARGCTVNACAGREETGGRRRALTGADFETMEGAASALVGRELGIPVCEVRAISNIASARDMRRENIDAALGNLGVYIGPWLGRNA